MLHVCKTGQEQMVGKEMMWGGVCREFGAAGPVCAVYSSAVQMIMTHRQIELACSPL